MLTPKQLLRHLAPALLLLLAVLGAVFSAAAQGNDELSYRFIQDSIELSGNGFQFNSLRIQNKGNRTLHLAITPAIPAFVNLITELEPETVMEPGAEIFIPLRFSVPTSQPVDSHYTFGLQVAIKEEPGILQTPSFRFWMKPYYRLRCTLAQTEQILTEQMESSSFTFRMENLGNTTDQYTFSFDLPKGMSLRAPMPKAELQPGEIRDIEVPLQLRTYEIEHRSDLNIYIRSSRGEKRMLIQKFSKIGHQFTQNIYRWEKMPLTLEMNIRDVTSDRRNLNFGARGQVSFGKDRNLELFLVSKNYYRGQQVSNDQGYITYSDRKNRFSAGYLTEFDYFSAYGLGGNLMHHYDKKGSYVRAGLIVSELYKSTTSNLQVFHTLNKKFAVHSAVLLNQDRLAETNSILNISRLEWNIDSKTKFHIKGGGGTAHINQEKSSLDTSMSGLMTGYTFERESKKWNLTSNIDLYGRSFPGINKGFNRHQHEVRRNFKKSNLSIYFNADKRVYNHSQDSAIKLFFLTNNKDYGIRHTFYKSGFYLTAAASLFEQQQDSASSFLARMARLTMNAGYSYRNLLMVNMTTHIGKVSVTDNPGFKPYYALNSMMTVQYRFAGLQLQYDRNPYYYYEIKQQIVEGGKLRRIQAIPYVDYTFEKLRLNVRNQYFYIRDGLNNTTVSYVVSQLTYKVPKHGINIRFSGAYSLAHKEIQFTNLIFQKDISAPFYRKNKSFSFKAVLYKDRNANNQYDAGDDLMPAVDVLVNNIWLRTGSDGALNFKNVGTGSTEIDFTRISGQRGWIPRDGMKQKLIHDAAGKKLYIPFKESRTIRGHLELVSDDRSEKRISLSNIRITATDENGTLFHTITDSKQDFFFDLPAGKFSITINQEAFEQDFIPTEVMKLVDLTQVSSAEISFEIRQRKRLLNIKHDDDDDDDDDNE